MIITTTQKDVEVPGGKAKRPTEVPARGWLQVAKRGWKEAKADQVPLLAAGVAFYAFLSIFPALIAIVSIYGLFADPSTITNQLNSMTAALPEQAKQVITDQVTALASRRSTLGIGLIISVAIALWSASAGINNLLTAITVAYDEEEKRGFIKKRLMSLGLTLGAIVFMVIMLGIVAVLPPLLKAVFGTGVLRWVFQILGWLVLVVLVAVALAILIGWGRTATRPAWPGYRLAPSSPRCFGSLPRSGSRSIQLPLATTPRPMAFSPESWCCCSGCGSACTRSCSVPRSTPSPSSKRSRTLRRGRRSRSATVGR